METVLHQSLKSSVPLSGVKHKTLRHVLQIANCQHYYQNFMDNGVDIELFEELDESSLKEIGIEKVGDRMRLVILINELKLAKLQSLTKIEDLKSMINNMLLLDPLPYEVKQVNISEGDYFSSAESVIKHIGNITPLLGTPKEVSKSVTFILQDGTTKKVNISGCFNAQSIKRKVLKKLGVKLLDSEYDTYVHSISSVRNEGSINLLYDVELVTICYSPDRLEKNRIILCPNNEYPSMLAQETSRRIIAKHEKSPANFEKEKANDGLDQYRIPEPIRREHRHDSMRNFFGQRPPSELISSNLGEYFPDTRQRDLEETVRNSVRYSMRLSKKFNLGSYLNSGGSSNVSFRSQSRPLNRTFSAEKADSSSSINERSSTATAKTKSSGRTIGEVMFDGFNAIEEAVNEVSTLSDTLLPSQKPENNLVASDMSSTSSNQKMFLRTSFISPEAGAKDRQSRIELLSVDSEEEDDDVIAGYGYLDDSLSGDHEVTDSGLKRWLKGARIGAGSFGIVYLGMNAITGELMAVKQVAINKKGPYSSSLQNNVIDALEHEMSLLKELNHENIVRYLGASTEENYLNIFLEYVPGGSVLSMLNCYGPFEEPLIRNFIRQVLIGLSYLHGEGIMHRDIKGANILIDIKGTVKISDFGISKRIDNPNSDDKESIKSTGKRASLQGSVYWMAPEVVKQTAYTKKADIWSVGCLIIEMFTGKHPFPDFSQMQAIFKIGTHTAPLIPDWCTAEAIQFLTKTFELDYEKRPDAVDLLSESFMNPLIMPKK